MSEPIAEEMTSDEALRYIVAELRKQTIIARGAWGSIHKIVSQTLNASNPVTRAGMDGAMKTVVVNEGGADVIVWEKHPLEAEYARVGIVKPGDPNYETPLAGRGDIKITTLTTSQVSVTTYLEPVD